MRHDDEEELPADELEPDDEEQTSALVDYSALGEQPWWCLPEGDAQLTQTISGLVTELRSGDAYRRSLYRFWDSLYDGDCNVDGIGNGQLTQELVDAISDESIFNYAARALDQMHSKVTAEVPTVRAAGRGAQYEQHIRARSLSHFIVGATDALKLPTQVPRSVHCSLRVGTGAIAVGIRDGDPCLEVIHPRELLVDPDDASQGEPRCLYRIRPVDKRTLLRLYPDRAADIRSASCVTGADSRNISVAGDWTLGRQAGQADDRADLIDAWILPDGDEPGRHVQCLSNGAPLVDEGHTSPRFPVAILRAWEPAVGAGMWGRGLLERVDSAQLQQNELWNHLITQLRASQTILLLPDGSDIAEGALTDHDPIGVTVIRTKGPAKAGGSPVFMTPNVIGPEVMPTMGMLKADTYTMAGTDESAVGSQSPLGRDASGIAIRTYHDFQSQGHVDLMKRIGSFVVDVVERIIDVTKQRYQGGEDWEVRHPTLDVVKWSDVDMDRDAYVLELEEVSAVPDTQAGALQQIEEDAAAGRIPPEYLVRLREDPDQWWMDRCNAMEDVEYCDWMVEQLLDPSKDMPELDDDCIMPMLIDRLRREILASRRHNRPPEVIDRLKDMKAQATEAEEEQMAANAAKQMAMTPQGGLPGAGGAPPAAA